MLKLSLICFCCCFVWKANAAKISEEKPPHIILILADDLGFDDVSFRGSKEFLTPNIDALAYHGKILDRLYAPAMCTPSRSALLTGKFPIHTGTQHFVISNEEPWALPTNLTTIAQIFKNAGYSTNLVGKWHLGFAKEEFTPTYRGFDYHYGYWGSYIDYYQRRSMMPKSNLGYDFRRNLKLECAELGTYVTDLLTQESKRLILSNNNTRPLFLLLNHLAPHTANIDDPLQAPVEEIMKFRYIKDPRRRKYAAMVSRLDQSVGEIIHTLDQVDMLKNSIVIFYSDNGAPSVRMFSENSGSNWPLRGQKSTPWEGGVRVTGAIWSPLLHKRSTIFRPPLYVGDWLPTLAEAAGITLDPYLQIDGISMWPELVDGTDSNEMHEREIVHSLDDIWKVVSYMRGKWKYINGSISNGINDNVLVFRELYDIDPRDISYVDELRHSLASRTLKYYDDEVLTQRRIESLRKAATVKCGDMQRGCNTLVEECLFNIELDPCEQNNLAHEPQYKKILQEMRLAVNEFRQSAWPPGNRAGKAENDPTWHDCTWTNFLEKQPERVVKNCEYYGRPCETAV